jgi:hypothetical protein
VLEHLSAQGTNLVLPKVGGSKAKIEELTNSLRASGYKVNLVNMDVTEDNAAHRALRRFLGSGHLISSDYFREVDGNPAKVYAVLKNSGHYSQVVNVDNNHPIGHHAITEGKDTLIGAALTRPRHAG